MERSAGTELGVDAGGVGSHAGAAAEGNPQNFSHGTSAGAGPLPARQTTIACPTVGGKGNRDFRITGRGDGTGREDLALPAQPLVETATAPGTSGAPG